MLIQPVGRLVGRCFEGYARGALWSQLADGLSSGHSRLFKSAVCPAEGLSRVARPIMCVQFHLNAGLPNFQAMY